MRERVGDRECLILGAYLHDIGKFEQRARKHVDYDREDRAELGDRGLHSILTEEFIKKHLPDVFSMAASIAFYHHRPIEGTLSEIVARADSISAEIDRTGRDEKGDPRRERLIPVLSTLSIEGRGPGSSDYRFPLVPLTSDSERVIPTSVEGEDVEKVREEYEKLWSMFVKEFDSVVSMFDFGEKFNFRNFIFTIDSLMKKYAWCVPSAIYESIPDISLYDHARTTAAVADCIYMAGNREEFILLGGDFSGIQNFIYELRSPSEVRGEIAKRLRGRSFSLFLLAESLTHYIMEELDLYAPSVLWSGGGNFELLLPGTDEVMEKLDELVLEVEKYFFEEFRGRLSVNFGVVKVSGGENLADFRAVRSDLWKEINRSKKRKFLRLMAQSDLDLSSSLGRDVCRVCGVDVPGEYPICERCEKEVDLGKKIPRLKNLVLLKNKWEGADIVFSKLNCSWLIDTDGRLSSSIPYGSLVVSVNPEKEIVTHESVFSVIKNGGGVGFKFIGNAVPWKEEEKDQLIMEFNDMASEASGASYIGVLRMDVDNLGLLFTAGLGDGKISRLASLSTQIDYFFSSRLNTLCETAGEGKVYITYSGGDDLFLVGPWDKTIELATRIRDELGRYSCHNPAVTISGGVFISRPSFPINKSSEGARDMLERAKRRKEKDALRLMGETLSWEDAIRVLDLVNRFLLHVRGEKEVPRSIFQRILGFYEEMGESKKFVLPRLVYLVTRKGEKFSPEVRELFLRDLIGMGDLVPLVCRLVLMFTREKKEKQKEVENA